MDVFDMIIGSATILTMFVIAVGGAVAGFFIGLGFDLFSSMRRYRMVRLRQMKALWNHAMKLRGYLTIINNNLQIITDPNHPIDTATIKMWREDAQTLTAWAVEECENLRTNLPPEVTRADL